MISALCQEIKLRKSEINETIKTIYFGGGTPSICSAAQINHILHTIYTNFKVSTSAEITLEANPDDLSDSQIEAFADTKIDRLSIGVQSFFEDDLQLMNRAHNAEEAFNCINTAKKYFENISIDLIYGIPEMSNQAWKANIKKAIELNIPHISSYALTVEPKTALEKQISKGIVNPPSETSAEAHYQILTTELNKAGYINYEFSNFGKEGFFSKNNTAYWQGEKYIGIGPSAHSFNGISRSWNIANNNIYLKEIDKGVRPFQEEELTLTNRYNEYIMTGLRTIWGVSDQKIKAEFGNLYVQHFLKIAKSLIKKEQLIATKNHYHIAPKSRFLSDGIASDLFFVD